MTGVLEYSSNNSGGSWWLTDQNWLDLEAAGWTVKWKRDDPNPFWRLDKDGRWLGALATEAAKETDDPQAAVDEWERITGQTATDEGCNCCGPPHSFSYTDADGNYSWLDVTYGAVSSRWT